MKKLETLLLSRCLQLCEFPEIQRNMDKMVELSLGGTGIKVVPSSIGQYCTNLLSLDFRGCESLEIIEGNFHLLKHLKEFHINFKQLEIPAEGLFHEKCCLEVLDLFGTSFKNLHPGIVSMKFLGFPHSLRRLRLSSCKWINGDISYVLCELSNLQVLDLSGNTFSRLNCSLLQLSSLKFLNLSSCDNLVELPDLPSSIAILEANYCRRLENVVLPTNVRCLWKISLSMKSIPGDVERKVQSMLLGNAIKDYSISLSFHFLGYMGRSDFARRRLMLELPQNWHNEFSGLLICINAKRYLSRRTAVITVKDVMGTENENLLGVSDRTVTENWHTVSYIYLSFGSLRHTSWWKSTHTTISFCSGYLKKVELVPGRSKSDSIQRVKERTQSEEFWDSRPIEIIHDSKSCIQINWCHDDNPSLFR